MEVTKMKKRKKEDDEKEENKGNKRKKEKKEEEENKEKKGKERMVENEGMNEKKGKEEEQEGFNIYDINSQLIASDIYISKVEHIMFIDFEESVRANKIMIVEFYNNMLKK